MVLYSNFKQLFYTVKNKVALYAATAAANIYWTLTVPESPNCLQV